MSNFRPDVEQQRPYLVKGLAASANHYRQLAFLQRDYAAGNGRVDHVRALLADLRGESAAHVGTYRAHINENSARAHSRQHSIRTFGNGSDSGGIGDHRKNEV